MKGRRIQNKKKKESGFTLLEILVAFIILAFSMTAIYQSAGNSVRAIITDEQRTYAWLLAESVMNSYQGVPPGGFEKEGKLENGYRWNISAEKKTDSNPGIWPLYDVSVTVSWGGSGAAVHLYSIIPEVITDAK